MKKTDIAMIVFIASISVIVAYFVATTFIGSAKSQSVKVKTADRITSSITQPDPTIFNSNAINPTVEVIIGGSQTQGTQ